jgi:aryl-alcohol dehydrogenase-like predicted oxidoreductase
MVIKDQRLAVGRHRTRSQATVAAVSLAWLLAQPTVGAPIASARPWIRRMSR